MLIRISFVPLRSTNVRQGAPLFLISAKRVIDRKVERDSFSFSFSKRITGGNRLVIFASDLVSEASASDDELTSKQRAKRGVRIWVKKFSINKN